jgi:hypothetical protein
MRRFHHTDPMIAEQRAPKKGFGEASTLAERGTK